MTDANDPTRASGQESTDDDQADDPHLLDGEQPLGHTLGELFIEPEQAAVRVETKGRGLVWLVVREATNARGLKLQWLFAPAEARDLAAELEAVAADAEAQAAEDDR